MLHNRLAHLTASAASFDDRLSKYESRQHKHYGYYIAHCSKDGEIGHALEQAIWITCFMRNVFIRILRDSVHINYTNAANTVAECVE